MRRYRRIILFGLFSIAAGALIGAGTLYWLRQKQVLANTARSAAALELDIPAAPRIDGTFPCVFAAVEPGGVFPDLGKCAMPTEQAEPVDRFEADLRYGRFVLRQTDFFLSDVFAVAFTRSYASWRLLANPVHAFGRNANHSFDIAPLGSRHPHTYQVIVLEDADVLYFGRISEGTSYADAVFQHTETATRFYKATQRWNGDGWTTRLANGTEIIFPEAYNARTFSQGAPTEIHDDKGNRLELHRDRQRNLQGIRTPGGHWIKFAYDSLSRITQASSDDGRWARYAYNADGMLESAILSSGQERHYLYDGALMTAVKDERGNVLLRNSYESGVLRKQEFGNGEVYSYTYEWASNRKHSNKVVVTLPNLTQRELWLADTVPEFVKKHRP